MVAQLGGPHEVKAVALLVKQDALELLDFWCCWTVVRPRRRERSCDHGVDLGVHRGVNRGVAEVTNRQRLQILALGARRALPA